MSIHTTRIMRRITVLLPLLALLAIPAGGRAADPPAGSLPKEEIKKTSPSSRRTIFCTSPTRITNPKRNRRRARLPDYFG